MIKGFRKKGGSQSTRCRLPVTPAVLRSLRSSWEASPNRLDATMLWAAACMCFFGFLRSGEVVVPSESSFDPAAHLAQGDVRVNSTAFPRYLEVRIKASKTDPFRRGVTVFLGVSGADICPVAAVLSYMVVRGTAPGPFFRFHDGRPLTRERFVSQVRQALRSAGIDASKYAGHSFRIGAATTASACGLQDSLIKTLGRWESSAYTLYIRTPREILCAVSSELVKRA